MMNLALLFVDRLASAGIESMVTGSVACIAYGEPRMPHDVDRVDVAQVDAFATERQ